MYAGTLFRRSVAREQRSGIQKNSSGMPAGVSDTFINPMSAFAQAIWTFTAFMPFLPCLVSNVTVSPSRILSTKPLTWTKISCPEAESVMKPKPLVSLKNLTVPFCIVLKTLKNERKSALASTKIGGRLEIGNWKLLDSKNFQRPTPNF